MELDTPTRAVGNQNLPSAKMTNAAIKGVVKELIEQLVSGRFDEIVQQGRHGRLTREEIERALADYPGKPTMPDEAAIDDVRLYDVFDARTGARNIEFDLWYDGVPSDLTLLAEVRCGQNGAVEISIDDIHVL